MNVLRHAISIAITIPFPPVAISWLSIQVQISLSQFESIECCPDFRHHWYRAKPHTQLNCTTRRITHQLLLYLLIGVRQGMQVPPFGPTSKKTASIQSKLLSRSRSRSPLAVCRGMGTCRQLCEESLGHRTCTCQDAAQINHDCWRGLQ